MNRTRIYTKLSEEELNIFDKTGKELGYPNRTEFTSFPPFGLVSSPRVQGTPNLQKLEGNQSPLQPPHIPKIH